MVENTLNVFCVKVMQKSPTGSLLNFTGEEIKMFSIIFTILKNIHVNLNIWCGFKAVL